jgi:hypothetical protein
MSVALELSVSYALERTCFSPLMCGKLSSLIVAKEFIFPLLFRELASLSVQELRFPSCSLGIYSLALETMLLI